MRRRPFLILIIAVVAVVSALGIVAFRTWAAHALPVAETDPARYPAVLATWQPTGLVKWFPPTIPSDAKSVHFSACPGALQGTPWIELRLQLPAEKVDAIEAAARGATTHVYPPDHRFTLPADAGNWPIPNYHTGERPEQFQFPATFKIYVIDAVDRGMGSWDPYDSYGVAISKSTGEVIYWAGR